jgi:molybdopterin molybdotransferase
LALEQGSVLSPGAVGLLSGLGFAEVDVYPQPSVALLVTGKELQTPGIKLSYGQVYESNSFTLRTALKQMGISKVAVQHVDDTLEAVEAALTFALHDYDLVLLTGGISVGDLDFVLPATEQCGVTKLFHKVAQKPGKPLFFGKKQEKVVFGLPGNPSSVLTCFYQYVVPALEQMTCRQNRVPVQYMRLNEEVRKPKGLTHFLKAAFDDQGVVALSAQESFRMRSFAVANCLIELAEDQSLFEAGTMVPVHLLPF